MLLKDSIVAVRNFKEAYVNYCKPLCRELGMPQMALDILLYLADNREQCTARDISRLRGFKENILSVNINKLVVRGYLERVPAKDDRRKVNLVCTEKAQSIIKRGREAHESFILAMRQGLTEDELETLYHCLDVINENAERIRSMKL